MTSHGTLIKRHYTDSLELRRYRDGFGVTHLLAWCDDERNWYYICNVNTNVHDKREAEHDALGEYVTCVRCMCRTNFVVVQKVGLAVANTRGLSKIDFDVE